MLTLLANHMESIISYGLNLFSEFSKQRMKKIEQKVEEICVPESKNRPSTKNRDMVFAVLLLRKTARASDKKPPKP